MKIRLALFRCLIDGAIFTFIAQYAFIVPLLIASTVVSWPQSNWRVWVFDIMVAISWPFALRAAMLTYSRFMKSAATYDRVRKYKA